MCVRRPSSGSKFCRYSARSKAKLEPDIACEKREAKIEPDTYSAGIRACGNGQRLEAVRQWQPQEAEPDVLSYSGACEKGGDSACEKGVESHAALATPCGKLEAKLEPHTISYHRK